MANVRSLGNAPPLSAPAVQLAPDLFVKGCRHGPSIANFCDGYKQPFALGTGHSAAMAATLNERLSRNLRALLEHRGISFKKLGKLSGVGDRTVSNYCQAEIDTTATGKQRSAKLHELELIAQALGIDPLDLLREDWRPGHAYPADALEIAALLANMPADDRAHLVAVVRAMAVGPRLQGDAPTGSRPSDQSQQGESSAHEGPRQLHAA